jgi:hypothetical protein
MIDITTPALLFPALSLLLLAYTNRFITLANLIRKLHQEYRQENSSVLMSQIDNLKRRIRFIKTMQIYGVGSLLLCVLAMALLFFQVAWVGEIAFALSLAAMLTSLGFSLAELFISVDALSYQISDLQEGCRDEEDTH